MPATVISFEGFRRERDRERAEGLEQTSETAPDRRSRDGSPLFRPTLAGEALSPRQIAHRRAILDYWNQLERIRLTTAVTERVGRPR
jgi:hypothetical protein